MPNDKYAPTLYIKYINVDARFKVIRTTKRFTQLMNRVFFRLHFLGLVNHFHTGNIHKTKKEKQQNNISLYTKNCAIVKMKPKYLR